MTKVNDHRVSRTYFISRHSGAREWLVQRGIRVDHAVEHLDVSRLLPEDIVIGTLPMNVAAAVCERGVRFLSLMLDLPSEMRGKELCAEDLERYGARLEEYRVERVFGA